MVLLFLLQDQALDRFATPQTGLFFRIQWPTEPAG